MKYYFLFSLLWLCFLPFHSLAQEKSRIYFFDTTQFIGTNNEIVLIVNNPQTTLAKELGSKIYSNRDEIERLVRTCYEEIENKDIESYHFCFFDLWFYRKSGNNLIPIGALNSNCDLKDVGVGNAQTKCTNLELFQKYGQQLRTDTISRKSDPATFFKKNPNIIFYKIGFKEAPRNLDKFERYSFSFNATNFPISYYRYHATDTLIINTGEDINKQIISYLEAKGIKQIESLPINWHFSGKVKQRLELMVDSDQIVNLKIEVIFEFNKEYKSYFSNPLEYKYQKKKSESTWDNMTPIYVIYILP